MPLTVVATGPFTSVQDRGRPGLARSGISPAGAADRSALALGNRLVGNPEDAAGLEVTMGGLVLRADEPTLIGLTGADAGTHIDGRAIGPNTSAVLGRGATLTLGTPAHGLRTYVTVRGGIAVPPVLGSRSHDTLSGLGPPAVRVGAVLPVGTSERPVPELDWAAGPADPGRGPVMRCRPGPRLDWFADGAPRRLFDAQWRVTPELDRVGVRLSGPDLPRRRPGELASEGLVRGAIQVPPSGQPLIFLADYPTTGGYPVIAVVVDADTDALAQLRPGQLLRLAPDGPFDHPNGRAGQL